MAWTLCTSGAAMIKAGIGVNSALSGGAISTLSDCAEAVICANSCYDWVANYGSLNANFKAILGDTASSLIAMSMISYDTSGYTSKSEAELMLNVLSDGVGRNLSLLKDSKTKDAIGA